MKKELKEVIGSMIGEDKKQFIDIVKLAGQEILKIYNMY